MLLHDQVIEMPNFKHEQYQWWTSTILSTFLLDICHSAKSL